MTWQLAHSVSISGSSNSVTIDHTFLTSRLIIKAECEQKRTSWQHAGLLVPCVTMPDIGIVKAASKSVDFGTASYDFTDSLLGQNEFTLEFIPYRWIPSVQLTFWENDMPLYTDNNAVFPANASSFTTSTPATVNATATKIAVANLARKGISFYNQDASKTVYIDINPSLTAALPAIPIPPKSTYVADINWSGDVWAIVASGTAANFTVRELM